MVIDSPFSLIGSHPCCPIQVTGTGMPGIAYFVCCLRNHIEVWPTATIAFPRWGPIRSDSDLLVGQSHIQLCHPSRSLDPSWHPSLLADDEVHTTLTRKKGQIGKRFRRSVTLIGDGHPSVVRVNGWGLEPCHYAAVVQDQTLWVVDLTVQDIPLEDRVQRLINPGDRARLRDVVLEFISVTKKKRTPQTVEASRDNAKPSADEADVVRGEQDEQDEAELDEAELDEAELDDAEQDDVELDGGEQQQVGEVELAADRSRELETVDTPVSEELPNPAAEAAAVPAIERARSEELQRRLTQCVEVKSDASEVLTSRVTERLISIRHTRSLRRRVLFGMAFLLALGGTAYFLYWLLRSIHWDWF
ncbi:eL24 family ribosomal protein [Roseimaritima ulvae]|nr:hypothetical protein [Roseimaritima ulvae]